MTNDQLKENMTKLMDELMNSTSKNTNKQIIAKAVQLGMTYQEEKIKEGIKIVFNEINKN